MGNAFEPLCISTSTTSFLCLCSSLLLLFRLDTHSFKGEEKPSQNMVVKLLKIIIVVYKHPYIIIYNAKKYEIVNGLM